MFDPFYGPANRPKDLPIQNFSGVGGGVTSETVVSDYDLFYPNELMEVFERHGHDPGFRLMLKTYGFSRGTAAPTTGHFEFPWKEDLVPIGNIITASTGPGSDVIVELDASAMYDTQVTSGGSARQASYPREGYILHFPDGQKGMIVKKDTTVTPHRLTIRPTKAAYNLATSIVIGEEYFISDTAWAEGSGVPTGVMPRIIKYTNKFQISKEAAFATGSVLTDKMYFKPVPGREGSMYLRIEADTYYRYEVACSGALLWGQDIDNVTVSVEALGFDVPIKGTEGLMDFATVNSFADTYTPGSYTISDFDSLSFYYEDERLKSRTLQTWDGIELWVEKENVLLALYNDDMRLLTDRMLGLDTGDPSDEFQPSKDSDWVTNIGFKAIRKAGYTYCFKLLHEFNKAMGAGSADYNYKQYSVIMPLGMTKDKSTGTTVPTFGYEYKELGPYSRENVVAIWAGAGTGGRGGYIPNATSSSDLLSMALVGEHAFHGACPNALVIQRP